jgi:DMSO reductase anchor subunit
VHPAPSIIVFTTLTGIGYGMLAWIGLLAPIGVLPGSPSFGASTVGLALVFITAGLLASTLHLGHPERAWRAISQWRSSWLSREGVAALATYVPAVLFAGLWLFGSTGALWSALGVLAAVGSAITVLCTSMIYHSLKPIRQWRNRFVVPNYLVLAAMTGAVWVAALVALFSGLSPLAEVLLAGLVIAAVALKLAYWRSIDASKPDVSLASATGLPAGRPLRPLDPPHTEENYLLKEMGYRIARRHAAKLRHIALALGFAAPLAALAIAWLLGDGAASAALAFVGALATTAGVFIERWLFFAEATHTVSLYYYGETKP